MRQNQAIFADNQPELEALHRFLRIRGWELVPHVHEQLSASEASSPTVWKALCLNGRTIESMSTEPAAILVDVLRFEFDKLLTGDTREKAVMHLLRILNICGWEYHYRDEQRVLILPRFNLITHPNNEEFIRHELTSQPEEIQQLVNAKLDLPEGIAARVAGTVVCGNDFEEAICRAFERVGGFPPWHFNKEDRNS